MLGTDPRDLRATFEIAPSGGFDIILADATPGGAGYARRLVEESRFSARRLFLEALEKLNCVKKCQTTCVHCLNDYSNQIWWDQMDRHISRSWLEKVVSRSVVRPVHVPTDAVPSVAPLGGALRSSLKGHTDIISVGTILWGSEETETALGSARALRDWLEDSKKRRAWMVFKALGSETPTGSDRQIAELLRPLEDSGRLTLVGLGAEQLKEAPRLTMFGGIVNEELYDGETKLPLLAGLGAGVSFRRHGLDDLASLWITKHIKDVLGAPTSGVFAQLLDRLSVHSFKAGQPRDVSDIFQELRGQLIEVEVRDPYIGASTRNRAKLGELLCAMCGAGASIEVLKLIWNPRNGEDYLETQSEELRASAGKHVSGKVDLMPWQPIRGQHFHDRVVHINFASRSRKWRIDITSGIDNLMSYQKECCLFIEEN